MRSSARALCLSRLYRYVCDAATMLAGSVGFTAMVVSLCGPTLSQSSSALPANEAGCAVTDDVQATPEIPPPPGPFVPLPALSVKLTRSLSSRSFAEPASAVVAPTTKTAMTIPDAKTRPITGPSHANCADNLRARSLKKKRFLRVACSPDAQQGVSFSADCDSARDASRGPEGPPPRPSRWRIAPHHSRRARAGPELRGAAHDGRAGA